MARYVWLVGLLLGAATLSLSTSASALNFGLIGGPNTNYAQGVMGGASAEGSGFTRQATTFDNVVIYRASATPTPVCLPILTAQILPGGGILFPPILLVSGPVPADPGLIPFAPAGTVITQGAW